MNYTLNIFCLQIQLKIIVKTEVYLHFLYFNRAHQCGKSSMSNFILIVYTTHLLPQCTKKNHQCHSKRRDENVKRYTLRR